MSEHIRMGGREIVFSRSLLCTPGQDVCGTIHVGPRAVPFRLRILDLPHVERYKVSVDPLTISLTIEMARGTDEEHVVTVKAQPLVRIQNRMLSLMFWSQRMGEVNAVFVQFLYDEEECG